ncbi:MAG: hypothetical protein U9Q82_11675 [Chloroflexota bacterium]|nr:hypothetical protein [Chloroflexota bacterium]
MSNPNRDLVFWEQDHGMVRKLSDKGVSDQRPTGLSGHRLTHDSVLAVNARYRPIHRPLSIRQTAADEFCLALAILFLQMPEISAYFLKLS